MVAIVAGTLLIVAITVVIGRWLDRRFSLLPRADDFAAKPRRPPEPIQAGETAAAAIRADASQLVRLRSQRCHGCRRELTASGDDPVRYAERDLIVLQFRCPACGAKRSLYVEPVA